MARVELFQVSTVLFDNLNPTSPRKNVRHYPKLVQIIVLSLFQHQEMFPPWNKKACLLLWSSFESLTNTFKA